MPQKNYPLLPAKIKKIGAGVHIMHKNNMYMA